MNLYDKIFKPNTMRARLDKLHIPYGQARKEPEIS